MIVVSDTTPINYLVLIGEIRILAHLFDAVIIPSAVHRELTSLDTPDLVKAWIRNPPDWVHIRNVQARHFSEVIDPGEAAAITLAEVENVPILIDDLRGRTLAQRLGIQTFGTIGILVEGHLAGVLSFQESLAKLRKTNFRLTESLVVSATKLLDESRQS